MSPLRGLASIAASPRVSAGLRRARTWAWTAEDELLAAAVGSWHRRPARRPEGTSRGPGHVLVIDAELPDATRDAGSATIVGFMRLLREDGHDVTFLAHDGQVPAAPAVVLRDLGIALDDAGVGVLDWLVASGAGVRHVLIARPDVAQRHLHRLRRWTAARVLYYTHDLHFMREARRADVTGSEEAVALAQRFRVIETRIVREVDMVLTPSTAERPVIEDLAPGRDVLVTVPFVDIPVGDPSGGPEVAQRRDLLFVGSFTHEPNTDAVRILVRDVMPRVWSGEPDARVVIVGQRPPADIRSLASERVEIAGHVPDLAGHLARARALVAPIRYGAGVKGKLLTSLAAGLPVVTTPVGNEGIDLVDGEDALIGDSPDAIAAHVISLIRDDVLAVRLGIAGRRFAREHFSESVTRSQLRAALAR